MDMWIYLIKCSKTSIDWSHHSYIKYMNIKKNLLFLPLLRFSIVVWSIYFWVSASFYADVCPLSKICEYYLALVWCGPITELSRPGPRYASTTETFSSLLASMCDCSTRYWSIQLVLPACIDFFLFCSWGLVGFYQHLLIGSVLRFRFDNISKTWPCLSLYFSSGWWGIQASSWLIRMLNIV